MSSRSLRLVASAVLAAGGVLSPSRGLPQNATTGALTGVITDATASRLPGASVLAVHEPSGTSYETVTGADGTFSLLNVRAGGPYTLTVDLSGFQSRQVTGLQIRLGDATAVTVALDLARVTATVTVVAVQSTLGPNQAGTAANIRQQAIETLPTVNRSLVDFLRTNPHVNETAVNQGASIPSIAGRNARYNNIQIDGAVNNDLFGLAESGTPGGPTGTQPISLDAIQELQIVVSPYDVRQGGFSGGGINAITRSGSNQYHGTGYYYGRNEGLVGDNEQGVPLAQFFDHEIGASLGGPFRHDRAFFFANVEVGRRDTPAGFSIAGNSGQAFGREAEAARFRSILQDRYGYDPGGFDEFIRSIDSNKVFVRGDANLSSRHRILVRYNGIDAVNDSIAQTTTVYRFSDNVTNQRHRTHSVVGQLDSTLASAVYNEFRLSFQRFRDVSGGPTRFPQVFVSVSNGGQFGAGRNQFSMANGLDQDVVEFHDDLTWTRGSHTVTVGTHNEFFRFDNLFIRDSFGTYRFASLDLLEQGLAQSYDYSYSLTSDPAQSARFGVSQVGVYGGDQWRVRPSVTLAFGLRLDKPFFSDAPTANPVAATTFGYATDVVPTGSSWSPRIGFNWQLAGERQHQLRGGLGYFSGRTPYVWLSNQYANTGIEFRRLRAAFNASNRIPFVPDPGRQPTSVGTAATNEIDVLDPDYQFPSLLRTNLAYDRQLLWGLVGTVEAIYSNDVHDIKYQNLNLVQTGTRPDGRPVYGRVDSTLSDVILLTNSGDGSQWSLSGRIERPLHGGLLVAGSYLYGRADSITDGTSAQAAPNWAFVYVPGDPNNPPVAVSNYDVRHRITVSASQQWRLWRGLDATVSAYYNGQTGRPYGAVFSGSFSDVNNDSRPFNDLVFVPARENDVIIVNGTWKQLDDYIEADESLRPFRGRIAERNAARSPWTNTLDFHAALGVPVGRTRVEFALDVLNVLNLVDSGSGLVDYAATNVIQPVGFLGVDAATGQMRYDVSPTNNARFVRDDLRSRWQVKLGGRVRF